MLNCFLISVVQLSGFSSLFPHGCLSSIRMPIIHLIPFLSANADICHFSEKKNKKFPNQFAPLCVFSLLDLRWEVVRNVLHLNHVEFIGPLPTLFFHQHLHPSDCMQDPPFQNVQMKSSDLELQLPSLHSSLTPLMWWGRTTFCKSHQIFFSMLHGCVSIYLFIYLFSSGLTEKRLISGLMSTKALFPPCGCSCYLTWWCQLFAESHVLTQHEVNCS